MTEPEEEKTAIDEEAPDHTKWTDGVRGLAGMFLRPVAVQFREPVYLYHHDGTPAKRVLAVDLELSQIRMGEEVALRNAFSLEPVREANAHVCVYALDGVMISPDRTGSKIQVHWESDNALMCIVVAPEFIVAVTEVLGLKTGRVIVP